MLIALMGDTFGRVIESKEQFGLQTKLEIMSDYSAVILNKREENDQYVYMFVVTKKVDENGEPNSAWTGNLDFIKKSVDKNIVTLRQHLEKKINSVLNQGLEAKTRDASLDKEGRSQYHKIMLELKSLKASQDAVDDLVPNFKQDFK